MGKRYTRKKARSRQDGPNHYSGFEVFKIENGYDAFKLAGTLWDRLQPQTSGDYAPYCFDVIIDWGYYKDKSPRVTAYYKTRRQPSRATVELEFVAKDEEVTRDLDDKIIKGRFLDEKDADYGHGLNYYKLLSGTNRVSKGEARIRLKTAYERGGMSAAEIARLMDLQGHTNNRKLVNFGGFPKGTLKLLASPLSKTWDEASLWYADYVFGVSPARNKVGDILPWNDWTKKQLVTQIPLQIPEFEIVSKDFAAVTGAKVGRVLVEVPRRLKMTATGFEIKAVTDPESTRLHREGDFSALDAMVVWDE